MQLALVSVKGGVGKTTTAVNLAAALADKGKRVLLVDLDPQGCSSLHFGVERSNFSPSIADALLGRKDIQSVLRQTRVAGLDLATASTDLLDVADHAAQLREPDRLLEKLLDPVRSRYHYILIDCPSGINILSRNAIVAASHFLIPTPPQFLCYEGVDNLIDRCRRLAHRRGYRNQLLGILLTMVDGRSSYLRETALELRKRFGQQLLDSEVRVNVKLTEAAAKGQPVFATAPRSIGALAFRALAEEVVLRDDMTRATPAA